MCKYSSGCSTPSPFLLLLRLFPFLFLFFFLFFSFSLFPLSLPSFSNFFSPHTCSPKMFKVFNFPYSRVFSLGSSSTKVCKRCGNQICAQCSRVLSTGAEKCPKNGGVKCSN